MVDELIRHIAKIDATLDRDDKVLFCANYKVASISVNQKVLGWKRGIRSKKGKMRYARKLLSYTREDLAKLFKFTIVRNPFPRIVSAYHYLQEHKMISRGIDFEDFVRRLRDLDLKFPHYTDRVRAHCSLQYPRAYFKGEKFVDFVAKLENIKEDWKIVAPHIGSERLPHANKGARKKKDYRLYYNNETISIMNDIYGKDLKKFGYGFE